MNLFKLKPLSISLCVFVALSLTACGGGGVNDTTSNDIDSTTGFTAKELAFKKIKAYANGETEVAPRLSDYMAAGVTGVTSETLAELNAIVKGLSPEAVDSTAELDALTAPLGINILPIVSAGGNQSVEVNKNIQITGSAQDADGTIVSYSWKMNDIVLATKVSFAYTPTVVGTDILTLTVTDNDGDTATDSMSLVVTPVQTQTNNKVPTANAGQNKLAEVGVGIRMVGIGNDTDGTIEAHEWSKADTVLATTPVFTYIPSKVGTDTLTLKVIDNDGATASDTVEVMVSAAPVTPNVAPKANAGGDKVAELDKSIKIIGSGSDSDGTIVSYVWTKGSTVLAKTALFNYIPTAVGTDTLTLTVTDNDGDSASDNMDVVVNDTPVTDTTAPIISLLGSSSVNVDQGTAYADAGATAADNVDGNITQNILLSGDTVNTNAVAGTTFTLRYNVSDAAGNAATEVTRSVKIVAVVDNIDPVIKLTGPATVEVIQGADYVESGATAADNKDGNITNKINIAGDQVNTSAAPGTTFTITYNVSDTAGNPAIEVTRTVSIIASPPAHTIPTLAAATIQNYLSIINTARSVDRTCSGTNFRPAVPPLAWSDKLYKSSYEHSQDMAESNTFSHSGSGTVSDWTGFPLNQRSNLTQRVATYAYKWRALSENIAAGTSRDTPQEAVDAWLSSKTGHCEAVMNATYTEVGMALSTKQGTTYTHYWTQNFGKPR